MFVTTEVRAETTIYVGKHFEIRDHDQPTKYVFNGSTRVARITGSLSMNTRVQRFRLHPGWNLLSLAVSATNLSDQLQSPGVVASAHAWNAQTGSYFPVPQVASSGMVLWVNATTNATLSVVGAYSDPVHREVPAGATYFSGTGLEAWIPNFPATLSVWHFSPQLVDSAPPPYGPWRSRLTGDLSAVNDLPEAFPPGQALYVINPAPFELEVPYPALRVRYYHQDHLGSSSVVTDASGALVEETAFYPFGIQRHEHRLRPVEESYKFTQKERDPESGLHYFEARFLAGISGRFISVDPKYAALETATPEPQNLNLYAYARNNPILYVDPTGLDFEVPELAGSFDEIDVDTTAEAIGGFLDSTWLGAAIKAPPQIKDAASFIGGIGDGIVDPMAQFAGAKTFGMGFGQFTRLAFGINNVDTTSPDYGGGKVLGTLVTFATGGAEAVALSAFRRAPAVAKAVIDPLADTAPAGGVATAASRGSGVGQIRSAPIGGGGAMVASPIVGGGGGVGAAGEAYLKIFQQQNQSLQAMRTIALGGEVAIDSAITKMAFDQADAIWRSTYGTRPPFGVPRR